MKFQENSWSCGAAAVVNALRVLGVKLSEKRVRAAAGTDEEGTDEIGVKESIKTFGFRPTEYYSNSSTEAFAWLNGMLLTGSVVILCINHWSHWVTAVGIIGQKVIIIDPANTKANVSENGVFIWSRRTLMEKWKNGRKSAEDGRLYAISITRKGKND